MAEQQIYDTLWREAHASTDEYREITIGYRALADKARLHRNTIDRNLASLQEKLAIEITKGEDRAENIGRTYRVYAFRSVLDRRAAAGLIWFMKDRSGVRLLGDRDLTPATLEVPPPVTPKGRGPVTCEQPGAVISKVSLPVTTEVTNLKKEEDTILGTSTSELAVVLRQEFGYVDDEALRRIVADCRKRVPDATLNEIADLTRMTARRIRSMRNLENPVGLLIVQVPKCFEGEAFETYRKAECARKEAEERNSSGWRTTSCMHLTCPTIVGNGLREFSPSTLHRARRLCRLRKILRTVKSLLRRAGRARDILNADFLEAFHVLCFLLQDACYYPFF